MQRSDQLITAIKSNHVDKVEKLLNEGVSPNGSYDGPHPLTAAVESDNINIDIIKLLLSKDACPTAAFTERAMKSPLWNEIMVALRESQRHTQSWIIEKMKLLYPSFGNLCCNGYAFMSVNAILSEEIDFFSGRSKYLYETDEETFLNDMEQSSVNSQLNNSSTSSSTSSATSSSTSRTTSKFQVLDINPFFDGIKLTYQPAICNYLMDEKIDDKLDAVNDKQIYQQVQPLRKFATSKKVEAQGGIHLSCRFAGMYEESEIKQYLNTFRKQIKGIVSPIALLLRNQSHALAISWNKKKNNWILIDVNEIPVVKLMQIDHDMAKKLMFNLFNLVEGKALPCVTEVYCLGKDSKLVNNAMIEWLKDPEMIRIHSLSNEKLKLSSHQDVSWFDISHLSGDPSLVRSIIGMTGRDRYQINKKTACGVKILTLLFACLLYICNQNKITSFTNHVATMFLGVFALVIVGSLLPTLLNYKDNNKINYAETLADFNSQFVRYAYSEKTQDNKYKPSIFDGKKVIATNNKDIYNSNIVNKPKITNRKT